MGKLLDHNGRPFRDDSTAIVAARGVRQKAAALRASYDAAAQSHDLQKWWVNADALSADAANSPTVRHTLRKRARYEYFNNSYCNGILQTIANDMVGWGPTLLMKIPGEASEEVNELVETQFLRWAIAIRLARKLRTIVISKKRDGEAIGQYQINPLLKTPVKLTLGLIEADQMATPNLWGWDPKAVDGIRFDDYGNPIEYHFLKYHPGSPLAINDYDRLDASKVLHWFREDRAGQHRGIPEITPSLNLFAMLRRYTLAAVQAAELQAELSAILTGGPANEDETPGEGEDKDSSFDLLEIVRGMLMTTPAGTDLKQLEPGHPVATYPEFKRELLNEISRCLNIPFNIAACNSSEYNYASGRLDHQTYWRSLAVEQDDCENEVLEPLFAEWVELAKYKWPAIMVAYDEILDPDNHEWMWPGTEHVDPEKESVSQDMDLRNHTLSYKRVYARQGLFWKRELQQKAEEERFLKEQGLAVPADKAAKPSNDPPEPAKKAPPKSKPRKAVACAS